MKEESKSIRIPAVPMSLAPAGHGGERPLLGVTEVCRNLRPSVSEPGALEAICAPEVLATLADRPVMADRRDDRLNVFTLGGSGELTLAVVVTDEGFVECPGTRLGKLGGGGVRGYARVGEFLAVLGEDRRLRYLLWHADLESYTLLGEVPSGLRLRVTPTAPVTLTRQFAPVSFGSREIELRDGVPEGVARQVAAVVADAYAALQSAAAAQGLWTSPVAARLAVRLWDGSLLQLGEPVACGAWHWPAVRAEVRLATGKELFTGTHAGQVSVTACGFSVTVEGDVPPAWRDVVTRCEVWTTEPDDVVAVAADATVSYVRGAEAHLLRVVFAAGGSERACAAAAAPLARQLSLPLSALGRVAGVRRPVPGVYERVWEQPRASAGLEAEAIAGQGGFLYLGGLRRRMPAPAMPGGAGDAALRQPHRCEVSVRLGGVRGGVVTASGQLLTAPGRVSPLLWYPSAEAVEMTVTLTAPDGTRRRGVFPLSPAASGEDAALWAGSLADGAELEIYEGDSGGIGDGGVVSEWSMPGAVATSMRGNPLSVAGMTGECGGVVRALAPLPLGGGAYTRQYLYAFTDAGVCALTHDAAGTHTNARMVAPWRVEGAGSVASGMSGVWALASEGVLLRLADARCEVPLRGLAGYVGLRYHPLRNELRLMPADPMADSLLVFLDLGSRAPLSAATRQALPPAPVEGAGDTLLTAAWGSAWRLYANDLPYVDSGEVPVPLPVEWRSLPAEAGAGGPVAVSADITSHGAGGELSVRLHSSCRDAVPVTVHTLRLPSDGGYVARRVTTAALLPAAAAVRPSPAPLVSLSVSGLVASVGGVTLSPLR